MSTASVGPTATPAAPSPGASGPSAPSTTTPAATGRTAIAQLTPFLDAAREFDIGLHALARMVNAGITTEAVVISPATAAAVEALDLAELAATVPAGMDARLMRATILVYSDLSCRRSAFSGVASVDPGEPLPRPGPSDTVPSAAWVLSCLGTGSAAAARFEDDLAALRALATSEPAFAEASAASEAAGEVAVRIALIEVYNTCGDGCGGCVSTNWLPVTWRSHRFGDWAEPADGTIGDGSFWATYSASSGWAVQFPMC